MRSHSSTLVRKLAIIVVMPTVVATASISAAVATAVRLSPARAPRAARLPGAPNRRCKGRVNAASRMEVAAGTIAERGVEIEIDPRLPTVVGDRVRLLQVLQNLIENAVKYMGEQRSPKIEVGADGGAGGPPDRNPVIYVRDNGMGIDPLYHEKVFGLFERLDATAEGTGVGLALVRRIVELHGGRIWVESEGEGMGSTFCFTLAAESAPASPD